MGIIGRGGSSGIGGIAGIVIGKLGIGIGGSVIVGISRFRYGNRAAREGIGIVGKDGNSGIGGMAGIVIGNAGIGIGGNERQVIVNST